MDSLVEVSPLFLPCVKAKLSKSGARAHALAPAAKQSPLPFIFPSLNFEPAWKSTSGNGMGGAEGAPATLDIVHLQGVILVIWPVRLPALATDSKRLGWIALSDALSDAVGAFTAASNTLLGTSCSLNALHH